jgi:PAS domain S-box-containing protein
MSSTSPWKPDFQALFEAAPGLFLVLLPDVPRYTIVAASDAYLRATMTRREGLLGRGIFEVFPGNPTDPSATAMSDLSASLGRVLAKRASDAMAVQKRDMRRPAESGGQLEERWCSSSNAPVFGPGAEVAYIIHTVEDVTEQHRLAEERQLFAALVENASDFIGIADPSGKPIYVNPAGRRMVGLAPDHPVGETKIPEYYPAEERAFAADVIVKATIDHGHWSGETHFRNWTTGDAIPVSAEHFMIRDASSGRVLGMGTITRDISEARRIAAEREQSLALAKELFDQASDSILIADLDGRFTEVNATACRMLGYAREELIGKTIVDIIPPEDVPRLAATREYLLSPGRVQVAEWTQLRKDGTPIPVEVSSKILPDGRWEAFVRDISERKRIEQALQESEERFRLTVDEAPIGMALVALDGRFILVNRALCESVGYGSAELTKLTFQAITHPDDLDADLALAGRLARGEIPRYQLGKRLIRKDGTIVDIMLSASVLRGRDGGPRFYIAQMEDITERKRAEKEIRDLNASLDAIIENVPLMLFVKESESLRFVRFNRAGQELLGWTMEELIGKNDYDFWSRAQADFFIQKDRETLQSGKVLDIAEEPIATRHQGIRILHTRKVPVLDPTGKPLFLLGISEDITERKRAEEALRVSEAKFSGIISIAADAIISIDDDQRITIFNDGAEKIFGYSRAEAIGALLDMLIPEPLRAIHRQHLERFAAGEGTARPMGERLTTIAGRRKNGEEFPAEAAISKLQVGDKTLLTVALRDITQRQRLEREQRFLAEAGAVLGATLDYERTLTTVARLVVRDFADWCVVELMGDLGQLRRLKVVSADPAKAALCAQLETLPIERDRPYLSRAVVETRQPLLIRHISAEQLESVAQGPEHLEALRAVNPVSLMALPLLSHGELLGTLAFVSSTPGRLYGQADLPLAEALADRAAVAIDNARLYRASVHATEFREEILGVVAHDLRNPLGAILMQASALERQGPEPERRSQRPREIIERAATRMNGLIQDLLDVASMEAGRLALEPARLAASALVHEVVEMQRSLAASSSLELQLEVAGELPEVWGDHDRLLQVFENLVGNAVKFTDAGGRIVVGADARDHEVVFRVADTGRGIAAENLPRIFDRFWQATTAGRSGAGLGLAIAKGIVEAHGGRIWVQSTPGQGSTFFFSIPKAHPA